MSKIKRRHTSWIDASFGNENDTELSKAPLLHVSKSCVTFADKKNKMATWNARAKEKHPKNAVGSQYRKPPLNDKPNPWTELHAPTAVADLCVSRGKLRDLEVWMENSINGPNILLLTGPCGSGKTISVKLLCNKLEICLAEWLNPDSNQLPEDVADTDLLHSWDSKRAGALKWDFPLNQSQEFEQFLLRKHYDSLEFVGAVTNDRPKPGLILVEDVPNVFFRTPDALHQILKKYAQTGKHTLVFVMSDSKASSDLNCRKLFPAYLCQSLHISTIQFKSCPPSFILKALERILTSVSQPKALSKAQLQEIANKSNGDIRAAVGTLQLLVQSGKADSGGSTKDENLLLFRALGKFLYSKRVEETVVGKCRNERRPLSFDPDEVVEKSSLDPETFALFLHHNYPKFTNDLECYSSLSNDFSLTDSLLKTWEASGSETKSLYVGAICGRSVAWNNAADTKKKWSPMYKPKFRDVFWDSKRLSEELNASFLDWNCSTRELVTEFLPYARVLEAQLGFRSETQWTLTRRLLDLSSGAANREQQLSDDVDFVENTERMHYTGETYGHKRDDPIKESLSTSVVSDENVDIEIDSYSSDDNV